MSIILSYIMPELANAFREHCGELDEVEVVEGDILELEVDAVVSPANSFGFMDGGIDMAYTNHFGWHVEQRLQSIIASDKYGGELLIGQAQIVPTSNERIPYLIAAPTMRVPTVLGPRTVNPYLAARAVLKHVHDGMPIFDDNWHYMGDQDYIANMVGENVKSVAFPGLGTGVGQVSPAVCAHQIKQAINNVLHGPVPFPHSLGNAVERQRGLFPQ
jgi:O-acetyl-ADP-ribose deacetylase (regulator of RNase III)